MMSSSPHSILVISFDGLAISGIVNGCLHLAAALRGDTRRVLFDLGYDITMGRTKDIGGAFLPPWVEPIRCVGSVLPQGYGAELIEDAFDFVVGGTTIAAAPRYDGVCAELAESLVATFAREELRLLIVANGTLPDNPLFTEALHAAITQYGARQKLDKYVLWKDHDLMWSAQPHLYGGYPYPGVRKPEANKHIHYAVTTEWMQRRMRAWAPSPQYHVISNRFFDPALGQHRARPIRAAYGIPEDAYLVARCTRVVQQKSIERDLRLLDRVQRRLTESGNPRRVFLFVTGPKNEERDEYERLRALEQTLSISGQVVWGDGLLPFNALMIDPALQTDRFSILDLLADADMSSFLTTYDYEGFGNPPGEAMSMGVPFISTTYELYQEVYGNRGAVAPLLSIDRNSSPADPIAEDFVEWVLRTLTDGAYREQIVRRNLEVCRRHFSLDALKQQVEGLFRLA